MTKHLSILTGIQNPSKNLIITNWSNIAPYSTSIAVRTNTVYNIVRGYSLEVRENIINSIPQYTVSIKICNDLIIRYLNLSDICIPPRSAIPEMLQLGTAKDLVGIEYCTRAPSSYPVRIDNYTFYKHDPSKFLLDDYLPKIPLYTFDAVAGAQFEVFDTSEVRSYGVF